MSADMELAGRVAIVTGASRNIGHAIATALAEAGASIVVNGRSNRQAADAVARGIVTRGGRAVVVMSDVADPQQVERLVHTAAEEFGRIDILVNNAASRPEQPLNAISLADWRDVMATIVDSAFLMAKACHTHLARSGGGAIINIGGISDHVGTKHRAHVVTAKAALIGLTTALAHDLAADGITANCVVPGLVATALAGNFALPQEVASAVRFLVGPQARYITGQTLHVNGGTWLG
jgi:3-oxoacyl-[acyl-carrier protein] reductase